MIGEQPDGTLKVERVIPDAVPDEESQRKAWLKERQYGIGGSDAASVIGVSPWKSALQLWAEKSGIAPEPNLDEVEHIEWGRELEEPIARKYVKITKRSLFDPGRYNIQKSEIYPWAHCTIDREVEPTPDEEKPGTGDCSIKNVGFMKREDWEAQTPPHYQVQLQHELAVTGLEWGSYAVLIGGQQFHTHDEAKNREFIDWLMEKEYRFMQLVKQNIPPEPDASDSAKQVLLKMYPRDTGQTIDLPREAWMWADALADAKADRKEAEEREQLAENRIKAAIGNATIGLLPDVTPEEMKSLPDELQVAILIMKDQGIEALSWKGQHRDGYTVKPTDFRVLRIVKRSKSTRGGKR